jgi:uncharacterized protein (TIGR03067 family)
VQDRAEFVFIPNATLTRLQGEWSAVRMVRDGQEMPGKMLATALRSAIQNEVKITFAGQLMMQALVRIDESTDPMRVDYYNLCGSSNGLVQQGILRWFGNEVCFCMAAPGRDRPSDFTFPPGSGAMLSQWRPKT